MTSPAAEASPTTARARSERIPTRRISFEESLADVPKHFAVDGDLVLSHLAVALSSVFPDGEDFFVRSVRNFRDRIDDPQLKAEVTGFIGQEATHGREHRALNERFAELGYPTRHFEKVTRKALRFREKVAPPISNLAATAALEHFTATLAELLLTNPEARNLFGDEAVRNIFVWHALEETEHKAVAFDVYKSVGGTERMRVWTMVGLRYGFVASTAVQMIVSLLGDRATYRKGVLRDSLRRFRRSPLVSKELWLELKDYDRPDFHPDDRDPHAMIAEWRDVLFGDDGRIKELLAGPSATSRDRSDTTAPAEV